MTLCRLTTSTIGAKLQSSLAIIEPAPFLNHFDRSADQSKKSVFDNRQGRVNDGMRAHSCSQEWTMPLDYARTTSPGTALRIFRSPCARRVPEHPRYYTQVSDCLLDLGVTNQYLDRTKISPGLLDHGSPRVSKRVRTVIFTTQPNRGYPLINQPGILVGAEMISLIDSARKCEVIYGAASPLKPREQACSDFRRNLELYRASGFLLYDRCSCSDILARNESSDLDPN